MLLSSCPHIVHILLLACHFIIHMFDSLWQRMAVNLRAAHKKTDSLAAHEVLLACFLLSCNTQSSYVCMDCVQCMKYSYIRSSRAIHESLLVCSPFCEFELNHSTKIEEHTRVQHMLACYVNL